MYVPGLRISGSRSWVSRWSTVSGLGIRCQSIASRRTPVPNAFWKQAWMSIETVPVPSACFAIGCEYSSSHILMYSSRETSGQPVSSMNSDRSCSAPSVGTVSRSISWMRDQ